MARLIYIESSPRRQRSHSAETAKAFLDAYRKNHREDQIVTIDLWKKMLPQFNGDVINAKYAILHGKPHTEEQAKAWKAVEEAIGEFKDGDKFVISLPMWNYSIPYKLKHYIDILVQPGYTFSYSPDEGYKGLVTGKKMLLICARGGAYGPKSGTQEFDHQIPYMKTILKFIGFEDISTLLVEPTLSGTPEEIEAMLNKAKEQAKKMAENF
jgi:FMN-dependent NADH-azoreductase